MINAQQSVANLVLDHTACAAVLQKYQIDFCCKGDLSLAQACASKGVSIQAVLAELEAAVQRGDSDEVLDVRQLSTAGLIRHIVDHHHSYLRQGLPFLQTLAAKVARVHGERNPSLVEVNRLVQTIAVLLLPHLDEEEQQIFPALLANRLDAEVVRRELPRMQSDHREIGNLLAQLRAAAGEYQTPDWACRSYRVLFSELERLEADTWRHVHLENHGLAPRFTELHTPYQAL